MTRLDYLQHVLEDKVPRVLRSVADQVDNVELRGRLQRLATDYTSRPRVDSLLAEDVTGALAAAALSHYELTQDRADILGWALDVTNRSVAESGHPVRPAHVALRRWIGHFAHAERLTPPSGAR